MVSFLWSAGGEGERARSVPLAVVVVATSWFVGLL